MEPFQIVGLIFGIIVGLIGMFLFFNSKNDSGGYEGVANILNFFDN